MLVASCKQPASKKPIQPPKGELAFLVQYNNRTPSTVGFLTNHIVERRLANLMKEDFEKFLTAAKTETPIQVNDKNNCVRAIFLSDTFPKTVYSEIVIDINRDAFWVECNSDGAPKKWADYPSYPKPVF